MCSLGAPFTATSTGQFIAGAAVEKLGATLPGEESKPKPSTSKEVGVTELDSTTDLNQDAQSPQLGPLPETLTPTPAREVADTPMISPEVPRIPDVIDDTQTLAYENKNNAESSEVKRSLDVALAGATVDHEMKSNIKKFLDGLQLAKPFLDSDLSMAELGDALKDFKFSEDEQALAMRFLQQYRNGKSKLEELEDLVSSLKVRGGNPDEIHALEKQIEHLKAKGEAAEKPEPAESQGKAPSAGSEMKPPPSQSKEYWQFLVICANNSFKWLFKIYIIYMIDLTDLTHQNQITPCLAEALSLRPTQEEWRVQML